MINALARLGGMVPGELTKSIQSFGITSVVNKLFSTHRSKSGFSPCNKAERLNANETPATGWLTSSTRFGTWWACMARCILSSVSTSGYHAIRVQAWHRGPTWLGTYRLRGLAILKEALLISAKTRKKKDRKFLRAIKALAK